MASQGYVDPLTTSYINTTNDETLTGDRVVTAPHGGIVVSGPNFSGYSLILSSDFANELYNQIYTASGNTILPSVNYIYPVLFSAGNGNSYALFNSDSNIITTDSTTFAYNNYITDYWQPRISFFLTTAPPTGYPASSSNQAVWTIYG